MVIQKCKNCGIEKELDKINFKIEKRNISGFDGTCQSCRRKQRNSYRRENIELFREKEARQRQTKKYKKYHNLYYQKNKQTLKQRAKEKYYENPEPFLKRSREQKERLGKKYKQYLKEYGRRNREKLNRKMVEKLHNNINFKLKHSLRSSLLKCLNGFCKKGHILDYLGCSIEFFKGFIESKFTGEMNWKNRGKIWQLDHIIPCRAFDFTKESDIHKCFHYTNFQPLLSHENNRKSDFLPSGIRAREILAIK